MKETYTCGLSYDRDTLKQAIIDLMDKLDTERLRALYLTALTWSDKIG